MKYTTPYTHQRQQILARILLTLWLPIMCSPETTFATPSSGSPETTLAAPESGSAVPEPGWYFVNPPDGERPHANVAAAQLLHAAVEQGDLAQVQKILERGKANIDAVDAQGQSALHLAIIQGHTEIAALLLQAGANLELKDGQNQSPQDYNRELAATAKVMQLLSTLEDLIAANLGEHAENKDKIKQTGNAILRWLCELEEETQDQDQHGHFRFKYHVLQASYCKALGDEKKASRYEKLATKYKKPATTPDTTGLGTTTPDAEEIKTLLAKIAEMHSRAGGASSSDINDEIQKILRRIKEANIIEDKVYENIQSLLAAARQEFIIFDGYVKVSAIRENFKQLMQEAILQFSDPQEATGEQASSTRSKYIRQLFVSLDLLVRLLIDQNRLEFIQAISTLPEKIEAILFSNLTPTEENITKRYRELLRHFHPDKAHWIPESHKGFVQNLMALINHCRETLVQKLKAATATRGEFNFYQEEGDKFWAMAMDYRHAQNKEWSKLTILRQETLAHLNEQTLNTLRIENATHAYEAYRACCKIADENYYRLSQINLRSSMALCRYFVGQYLEAQLYALGALNLIFLRQQRATLQALPRAQQILAKVQGRAPEGNNVPTTDQGSTSTVLAGTRCGGSPQALIIANQYGANDTAHIQNAIQDDLAKIAKELIFNSDRSLVRYQAAREDILRAKQKATNYKFAGGATIASGVVGGGAIAAGGVVGILQGAGVVTISAVALPVFAILGGMVLIGYGILSGRSLWKEGTQLMKEPVTREKLNEMMQQAVTYYDKGQPQQFLETLATEYAAGERLLSIKDFDGVPRRSIIDSLTKHGFRPDGIAYLFNLIGEALSSGKVRIGDYKRDELLSRAKDSFKGSLDEELMKSAAKLDRRITEMRKKDVVSRVIEHARILIDFFGLRDEGHLAREHVKDADEMPFTVRLEEMRNIAKLNIAMIYIVLGDETSLVQAKQRVKEVRDSIDRYGQFHTEPALRLAAIEDFVWIVSGQPIANEVPSFSHEPLLAIPNQSHTERNMEGQPYLTYLNNRLAAASSAQEKVKIYNERAAYYVREAKKVAEANHSESLQYWQTAQEDYRSALKLMAYDQTAQEDYTSALDLMPYGQTACLGYARCLLGLSQYDQTLAYLELHPNIDNTPDRWIMASIAYRKKTNYIRAKGCILEALQLNPYNQEAGREKALIEQLQGNAI